MARIFLSHSSANNAEALAVRDWLVAQGWDDVFLDLDPKRGIKAGERWQEALKRAAATCELVTFLISPAWVASKWCLAEFLLAKQMNKRIFGVIVESTPLAEIPLEMTSEWQLVDLTAGDLTESFPIEPPAWDECLQQEVTFAKDGLTRLRIGLLEAGLDARYFAWPPEDEPDRSPFRGLEPLDVEDAGIFFGRDGQIVTVLDRLRGLREAAPPRFFVILGASGAGKSSFMRAGLLPRLERDSRHFQILPVIRPGRAAISGETGLLASLECAFETARMRRSRASIRAAIDGGAQPFRELLLELSPELAPNTEAGAGHPPVLILPIDQGEELFVAEAADESQRLLELLTSLVTDDHPAVAVLVTMRSDSYEDLQTARPLKAVPQQTYSLPPMPRGAYSEVITGPARRLAQSGRPLLVEEQLVDALLNDIEQDEAKDALPLLAFSLERLYREHGGDGDLTLFEYEGLGRIRGSIEAAVEEAFQEANANPAIPRELEARRALLRRGLIPWLAGIDPDTGSPRRRVAPVNEIPPEAGPLIDLLVQQRLLTKDRDPETGEITLEPAHEALLRQWGLLKGWLEEDSGALATLEGVKRAAVEWAANGEEEAWLAHSGTRLKDARNVSDLSEFREFLTTYERGYLVAADDAERRSLHRERLLNRATRAAALIAVFGMVIAGWQWWEAMIEANRADSMTTRAIENASRADREAVRAQEEASRATSEALAATTARKIAIDQRDTARLTQSRFLVDLAQQELERSDAVTSILLNLEALPDDSCKIDRPHELEAEQGLYLSLMRRTECAVLAEPDDSIALADFCPNGSRILTVSKRSKVTLWGARDGCRISSLNSGPSKVSAAAVSSNGQLVLMGTSEGTVYTWDSLAIHRLDVPKSDSGEIRIATISQDDGRGLTVDSQGAVRIWNLKSGDQEAYIVDPESKVKFAEFLPDGVHVVTISGAHAGRVWESDGGRLVAELHGHTDSIYLTAYSPESGYYLTVSFDESARVWDPLSGKLVAVLQSESDYFRSAEFAQDGRHVLTGSGGGEVRLWDVRNGESVSIGKQSWFPVVASFDRDFNRILIRRHLLQPEVWDAKGASETTTIHGPDSLIWSEFSPDGNQVLSVGVSKARVSSSKGGWTAILAGHVGAIRSGVFSSSGDRVLTRCDDGTARIWNTWEAKFARPLPESVSQRSGFQLSPDGSEIALRRGEDVVLMDSASGDVTTEIPSGSAEVSFLSYSNCGSYLTVGYQGGAVVIWNANAQTINPVSGQHYHASQRPVLSPNGEFILTAPSADTVRVSDVKSGAELSILRGHSSRIRSMSIRSDSARVLIESEDNTARVWDPISGREVFRFKIGGDGAIFSPDGRYIIADVQGSTGIWDGKTGKRLLNLEGTPGCSEASVFSPDCTRVITLGVGSATVWSLPGGEEISILNHEDFVTGGRYSPDGSYILTFTVAQSVRLWDSDTADLHQRIETEKENDFVHSCVFSMDGRRVLITRLQSGVSIWDVKTGLNLASSEEHEDAILCPSGTRILQQKNGDLWRVWPVPLKTQCLVNQAKLNVTRGLTRDQRMKYYLSPEPPRWYITGAGFEGEPNSDKWRPLWPYQSAAWRDWLIARDRGEILPLPKGD